MILFVAFIEPVNDTFSLLFELLGNILVVVRRAAGYCFFNDVYKSVESFHVEFPLKCCYISALRSGGN